MCFIVKKSSEAKIAEKDIMCWKFVNPDGTNAFSGHLFHKGVLPIKYTPGQLMPRVSINKVGIPSFSIINEGYHSFIKKPFKYEIHWWRVDDKNYTEIKVFIIPAGTRYYENDEEYVSETIMML